MKKIATLVGLFTLCAAGSALAQPAAHADAPRCIPSNNIATMEALDNKTVLIHTGDGDVYSSTVDAPCAGLGPRMAVSIGTPQGGDLCAGRDVVTVGEHGTCRLGQFNFFKEQNPNTDIRDPRVHSVP